MTRLLNLLPFTAAPLFLASWIEISFPVWKTWPPVSWILCGLILLIPLGKISVDRLNPASLIALGCGIVLAAWRYCDQ
ncbi:hypothetical protein [Laspinema olomoucense]|uniref:hypothetical protein n=1 Tax=Laspinema olomoucense TaxID=3231600 RepID=UPI0021BA6123|nr:hypothetical protein [Laspinema sp. D3a]MCT7987635.1 hypothetical protein [Laspinema sp. D3a]